MANCGCNTKTDLIDKTKVDCVKQNCSENTELTSLLLITKSLSDKFAEFNIVFDDFQQAVANLCQTENQRFGLIQQYINEIVSQNSCCKTINDNLLIIKEIVDNMQILQPQPTTTIAPTTTEEPTTTLCQRPNILIQTPFIRGWYIPSLGWDFFNGTTEQTCESFQIFKSVEFEDGASSSYYHGELITFEIGSTVWFNYNQEDCQLMYDGKYWVNLSLPIYPDWLQIHELENVYIVTITNGIITEISDICSYIGTTTVILTTTEEFTTTLEPTTTI